jgi:acetylornithine deacetylase/succinyl-diaminopimelate desuccinylase-like protein
MVKETLREVVARSTREKRVHGCAAPLDGAPPNAPLFTPALSLELHIEQGPCWKPRTSRSASSSIAGYRAMERAHHRRRAPLRRTTPMTLRRDALTGAAEISPPRGSAAKPAPAVHRRARLAEPGLYNVVLHVRAVARGAARSPAELDRLAAELTPMRRDRGRAGLQLALRGIAAMRPCELSRPLVADALRGAEARVAHRAMPSGAHDSMVFAQNGVPALMLFVPSRDGVSHSPEEFTAPEQLFAGLEFALALIRRWGETPPITVAR